MTYASHRGEHPEDRARRVERLGDAAVTTADGEMEAARKKYLR